MNKISSPLITNVYLFKNLVSGISELSKLCTEHRLLPNKRLLEIKSLINGCEDLLKSYEKYDDDDDDDDDDIPTDIDDSNSLLGMDEYFSLL